MSKEKALQILGLGEKFTSKELQNAFKSKVLSCEKGRGNAINDSIREGYESAIIECNSAHNLLKDYILIAPPILKVAKPTPKISNNSSTSKKKWLLPVSIVSGVIIVVILFFAFGNGNTNIDPATHDKYVSLKSQADLLAKQGNWEDALSKYNKAYSLDQTSDVNDSIISMTNHLLLASIKKNGDSDELTKATNNEKKLNNEDNVLKNKKEVAAANKEKELEARENVIKEAESLRKEKESLRLKIGDKYAGGIVFKIDAGGEHGLVCAPTDQGSEITPNEAKNVCLNLTLNGYSDWYLPSKYELNLIYINIGRGSSNGNIGKGISIGNNGWTYWSSTEGSVTYQAWEQSFWDGNQHENYTGNCLDRCFRAIRAF
jgi:tetratricopeptide (TPR) repeat protein